MSNALSRNLLLGLPHPGSGIWKTCNGPHLNASGMFGEPLKMLGMETALEDKYWQLRMIGMDAIDQRFKTREISPVASDGDDSRMQSEL